MHVICYTQEYRLVKKLEFQPHNARNYNYLINLYLILCFVGRGGGMPQHFIYFFFYIYMIKLLIVLE